MIYPSIVPSICDQTQSGGFSEIVVVRPGGFRGDWRICVCFSPIKSVLFGRACLVLDMAVLKQRKVDGERRVFQDRSVCLHSTEKEFLCV